MVRKRRTPLPTEGQSSGSQETAAGRGAAVQQQPQQPLQQQEQGGYQARGGRGSTPQPGGYAGRGGVPLPSEGQSSGSQETAAGRAGGQQQPKQPQLQQPPPREGYAAGRGGVPLQQHYGGPSEYQQGRGSRQYQQEDAPQGSGGPPSGAPSRSPVSQLPRDILKFGTVDIGSLGESQDEAGPSSRAPKPASPNVVQQQLQQTSILEPDVAPSQDSQPASSKSMMLPLRPGKGRLGIKCFVTANHFYAELPDKDLHQYDVSIIPEVKSRRVNRIVIRQLVENYRVSFLGKRLPAYDGRKSLYTAGPLPFVSEDFNITIIHEQEGGVGKEQEFKVQIKFASRPSLYHLSMFLEGRQADAPKEVFQALDIVLCEGPNRNDGYRPLGRCFYRSNLATRLDGRLEIQRGFCQSFRPTQMGLSLNFDLCSAIFIKPIPVLEFVEELLQRDVSARPLSEAEHEKVNKALRGIKVETTHRGNVRRKYPISEITKKATRELRFSDKETGEQKSVVEYFREAYELQLRCTHLPCLQIVDKKGKTIYLPMEVCKIMKGQRYSKGLLSDQKNALSMKPYDRQQFVLQYLRNNNYRADRHAQEFGIRIDDELTRVEARILPAPRLKFNDLGQEKGISPSDGKWTMWNKRLFDGGTVKNWTCLNLSLSPDDEVYDFCNKLAQKCRTSGMNFNPTPVLSPRSVHPGEFKKALAQLQNRELDLLIVILPDNNGSLYGNVKRICDTELGIVSQCCLSKHVFERKMHYMGNVALKINVKVGGRNVVLVDALEKSLPLLRNTPTIIFGADVTHPDPGDKSSPSIAAVVASQDWPGVSKYNGLVSAQENRKELIQDLYQESARGIVSVSMIRELLISFSRATGLKPQRIIFYRDGVSEGQFHQVLSHEVGAIKKACKSLETNYNPKVTFVVVQKRHRTRLFADYKADQKGVDKNENIRPGTVVDSTICHPTQFDFYLCSHAGTKGTTSRPAHYHVLWDENNFTADDLQSLTYKLCYTFARCTQSVSIVPPAYYADLLAYRARKYIEKDKPFPSVKEKLKKFMFYC